MNVTHAVVTEGMHPAERERFDERIAVDGWGAPVPAPETSAPAAAADFDEETWGTDADAQARQAAAMALFGPGA